MAPLLQAKNVSVSYGNNPVLHRVSFSLDRGETVAVIGPNGSGKTTLLRAIIGSVPHEGEISMEKNTRIGYVPQKIDLERNLPLSVREFLLLAQKPKEVRSFLPKEIVEMVHLPVSFLTKSVSSLSSGEFQRVLIGFALISHPDLLLFDEPTASVDAAGQETVYELLHQLQDLGRFALMLVSHDLSIVYERADKVLCLARWHAHFGAPEEVLTPEELKDLYGQTVKFHRHTHL